MSNPGRREPGVAPSRVGDRGRRDRERTSRRSRGAALRTPLTRPPEHVAPPARLAVWPGVTKRAIGRTVRGPHSMNLWRCHLVVGRYEGVDDARYCFPVHLANALLSATARAAGRASHSSRARQVHLSRGGRVWTAMTPLAHRQAEPKRIAASIGCRKTTSRTASSGIVLSTRTSPA